jgi:succinoglycan biosynthesis transport protein ExoP
VLQRTPHPAARRRSYRLAADYLTAGRRHALLLVLCVLGGTALGAAYGVVKTPVYFASSAVLVTPTGVTHPNPGRNRAPGGVDLDTEIQLARSERVTREAADVLGIPTERLSRRLTLSVPPNSRVLRFTFSDFTPQDAARGANVAAEAYLGQRADYAERILRGQIRRAEEQAAELDAELKKATQVAARQPRASGQRLFAQSQVQLLVQQVSKAREKVQDLKRVIVTPGQVLVTANPPREDPAAAVGRHPVEGAALGLLAGCALALVNGLRRRSVKGAADLAGRLPASMVVTASGRSVLGHRPDDLVAALIRRLPGGGVVAVTGLRGEADLRPSLEIARAVQRARYRTVVAVWPHGRSHPAPRGPATFGMAELLRTADRDALDFATLVDDVWVIGPGEATRLAAADTGRSGVRDAVRRLRVGSDYVLVQTSGPRAHLSLVVGAADAVIVVAQDRVSTAAEVTRVVERVGRERVVGVVLAPGPGAAVLRRLRRRGRRGLPSAAPA